MFHWSTKDCNKPEMFDSDKKKAFSIWFWNYILYVELHDNKNWRVSEKYIAS